MIADTRYLEVVLTIAETNANETSVSNVVKYC